MSWLQVGHLSTGAITAGATTEPEVVAIADVLIVVAGVCVEAMAELDVLRFVGIELAK